jgi:hypothetical protein
MSDLKSGTVINFLWKQSCLAKNVHDALQAIEGQAACAAPSVQFRAREFERGQSDIVDQPRPGRPPIDNLDAGI